MRHIIKPFGGSFILIQIDHGWRLSGDIEYVGGFDTEGQVEHNGTINKRPVSLKIDWIRSHFSVHVKQQQTKLSQSNDKGIKTKITDDVNILLLIVYKSTTNLMK